MFVIQGQPDKGLHTYFTGFAAGFWFITLSENMETRDECGVVIYTSFERAQKDLNELQEFGGEKPKIIPLNDIKDVA